MPVEFPKPIADYFAAENSGDSTALARCFTEQAVVSDEKQTMTGRTAIQQWAKETRRKYQHQSEPLAAFQQDGIITVTSRLSGNFPGSPIELRFVFRLAGDSIASLEIG